MNITEKAKRYSDMFKVGTRSSGEQYIYLDDTAAEELRESVHEAHGNRLPNDWIYSIYENHLRNITDYELETIDDLENVRSEIVDNQVDTYTSDLTAWLHDSNLNVDYLTQSLEAIGTFAKTGEELLSYAQQLAIDEVMGEVINLLSEAK